MSLQSAFLFVFSFLPEIPIVVEVSNEALSSDGGLIPIRQFDEQIGFTSQIAEVLDNRRDSNLTETLKKRPWGRGGLCAGVERIARTRFCEPR